MENKRCLFNKCYFSLCTRDPSYTDIFECCSIEEGDIKGYFFLTSDDNQNRNYSQIS